MPTPEWSQDLNVDYIRDYLSGVEWSFHWQFAKHANLPNKFVGQSYGTPGLWEYIDQHIISFSSLAPLGLAVSKANYTPELFKLLLQLTTITTLSLDIRKIPLSDAIQEIVCFLQFPSLTFLSLDLGGYKDSPDPTARETLFSALSSCTSLTWLGITYHPYGTKWECNAEFSAVLSHLVHLQHLEINSDTLTCDYLEIPPLIRLETLIVAGYFRAETTEHKLLSSLSQLPSLHSLVIQCFKPYIIEDLAQYLPTQLKRLFLMGFKTDMDTFLPFLGKLPLEFLHLNSMLTDGADGEDDYILLVQQLPHWNLTSFPYPLNLWSARIQREAAKILPNCPNITDWNFEKESTDLEEEVECMKTLFQHCSHVSGLTLSPKTHWFPHILPELFHAESLRELTLLKTTTFTIWSQIEQLGLRFPHLQRLALGCEESSFALVTHFLRLHAHILEELYVRVHMSESSLDLVPPLWADLVTLHKLELTIRGKYENPHAFLLELPACLPPTLVHFRLWGINPDEKIECTSLIMESFIVGNQTHTFDNNIRRNKTLLKYHTRPIQLLDQKRMTPFSAHH